MPLLVFRAVEAATDRNTVKRQNEALRGIQHKNCGDLQKAWSGYRESNPGIQLGRLLLYH